MKCLICGKEISSNYEFCRKCHKELELKFIEEAKQIYNKIKEDNIGDYYSSKIDENLDENHNILKKAVYEEIHFRAYGFSDLTEEEIDELVSTQFIEKYKNRQFIKIIKEKKSQIE